MNNASGTFNIDHTRQVSLQPLNNCENSSLHQLFNKDQPTDQ